MKKRPLLFLSLIMCLALFGCSSKKTPSNSSSFEPSSSSTSESSSSSSSEAHGYTVTFETNGGTPISPMSNVTTIETPPITTREGYDFEGWYRNSSLMTKANFPLTVVKDIVLYAKWNVHEITPDGLQIMNLNSGLAEAKAFISAQYLDNVLSITLNVADKTIYNSFTNPDGSLNGMNDNIELFISPNSNQPVGLLKDQTYKVMVVPGVGFEVVKFNYSTDGYAGSFIYSQALVSTGITATNTIRIVETDGYNGYSSTINVPYSLFSLNKASAINNLYLYLAMRNSDSSTITAYGESDYLGAQRRNVWGHWLVNEDGSFHVKDVNTIIFGDSYTDSQFFRTLNTDFANKNLYGAGASGSRASEWDSNYHGYFNRIINHHPQKVIINIGINDINDGHKESEEVFASIQSLINKLHESLPSIQIYWTTICNNYFYAVLDESGNNKNAEIYEQVNNQMKSLALSLSYLDVIDLNAAINRDRSLFISDGLHLNAMGYNKYAKLIYQSLGLSWNDGTIIGKGGELETSRGYDLSQDNSGIISTNGDSDQYAFIKTEGENSFILEASFTAKNVNHGDQWPKMGLVVKNGERLLFFYIEMYANLNGKKVGRVYGEKFGSNTGWNFNWDSSAVSNDIPDLNYTGSSSAKLTLENDNGTIKLYANDVLQFTLTSGIDNSKPCYPGFLSFNTAFDAKNILFSN